MKTGGSRAFTFWAPGLQQQTGSKRSGLGVSSTRGLGNGLVEAWSQGSEREQVEAVAAFSNNCFFHWPTSTGSIQLRSAMREYLP